MEASEDKLAVRIWSHDQGWSNNGVVDENNPYADSWSWFCFGHVHEDAEPGDDRFSDEHLHEFQTNLRATPTLHCHTNQWEIGAMAEAEHENDDLGRFLASLTQAPSCEIGIFPLARYQGWRNSVWKMEVETDANHYGNWETSSPSEVILHQSSSHFRTRRYIKEDEAFSIRKEAFSNTETSHLEPVNITDPQLDSGEAAIDLFRQAVAETPLADPGRAGLLNDLAKVLCQRFQYVGVMEDLDEAIGLIRQAIAATPVDDKLKRWSYLGNLGASLGIRFARTSASNDLDEAIVTIRQALAEGPPRNSSRPTRLCNLGDLLRCRYSRKSTVEDLEEALRVGRQAVEEGGSYDDNRWMFVRELGKHLADYFQLKHEIKDLDEAISITRQAVAEIPSDYALRTILMGNLGSYLDQRFSVTEDIEDRNQSTEYFRETLRSMKGSAPCLYAGRQLLSRPDALQPGANGFEDARLAVSLIPISVTTCLSADDKKHLLSRAFGIASNAAAIALHSGQAPRVALELAETGRGLLAGNFYNLRTDLSELREQRPEMADSFEALQRLLDAAASRNPIKIVGAPATWSVPDRRHFASRVMSKLLIKVRREPGFGAFLKPPTEYEMCQEAALGPIVVLNVSPHRCDALIIQASGVSALHLPGLTHKAIQSRVANLQSTETLKWLWDVVVGPVLQALGFTDVPTAVPWPRVWWIPTGALGRFPLHAAGYHMDGSKRTALDRVVSSYSSSIKTIIRTRRLQSRGLGAKTNGSVVVVSMNETPGQGPLKYAADEISAVRVMCCSGPLRLPVLSPPPRRDEMVSALANCTIFHFAGHGSPRSDPLQSLLYLQDWEHSPLTVEKLMETGLSAASPFLAYLSACATGKNLDKESADESVHLTSAFQLAGFRHVIGTLWEVNDHLCVDMARTIYESLGNNSTLDDASVSTALHEATRALREKWLCEERRREEQAEKRDASLITVGKRVETVFRTPLWVPYVHFGV
ncbi:CHAT domain-containing protein [Hirsutella rhossiliensis]|uniref:CHAT domain-containing protein n=1 Tax=Hirsutella rhossiliensis TaxID=111463 RepID=A0A9P8N3L1_9HYPO|nr:CHAT domain-containing protein [Hirsutella rhossiliensis]KAH0965977.1 CHAT domain-containing protein [Hirsutella rhossiliensis]